MDRSPRYSREFGGCAALPLGLDSTEHRRWDGVLGDEVTLGELDLAGHTTLDRLTAPPLGPLPSSHLREL